MLTLENIIDRPFKMLPVGADSDLLKVVKVGQSYYLKCPASRITCKIEHTDDEAFLYTFVIGNTIHGARIKFDDIFFIDFNNQDFKILKPQEYAAAKNK